MVQGFENLFLKTSGVWFFFGEKKASGGFKINIFLLTYVVTYWEPWWKSEGSMWKPGSFTAKISAESQLDFSEAMLVTQGCKPSFNPVY